MQHHGNLLSFLADRAHKRGERGDRHNQKSFTRGDLHIDSCGASKVAKLQHIGKHLIIVNVWRTFASTSAKTQARMGITKIKAVVSESAYEISKRLSSGRIHRVEKTPCNNK